MDKYRKYDPNEHSQLSRVQIDPAHTRRVMTTDESKLTKDERRLKENLIKSHPEVRQGGKKYFVQ